MKICDELKIIAKDSKMAQKHAAAIFTNKNNVLSFGINKVFKTGYGINNILSEHAEIMAIKSLPSKIRQWVLWGYKETI